MTGVICINKEKGISSFKVVAAVRSITGEKKVGHMGTLDPMASGVLPIMLGGATRFLDYIPNSDKAYRAEFLFGKSTDTLDITGTVMTESRVHISREELESVLPDFSGKILQIPPMFSAKSHNGVRLYELARRGIEIERNACEIEIKNLSLVKYENNVGIIDVICSKGTYIRSLIDDIGKKVNCPAVMISLERTFASGFSIEQCITLDELRKLTSKGDNGDYLISMESIFDSFEKITVTSAQTKRFINGGALDFERLKKVPKNNICTVYSDKNEFLGLGKKSDFQLKPERLLIRRD